MTDFDERDKYGVRVNLIFCQVAREYFSCHPPKKIPCVNLFTRFGICSSVAVGSILGYCDGSITALPHFVNLVNFPVLAAVPPSHTAFQQVVAAFPPLIIIGGLQVNAAPTLGVVAA